MCNISQQAGPRWGISKQAAGAGAGAASAVRRRQGGSKGQCRGEGEEWSRRQLVCASERGR